MKIIVDGIIFQSQQVGGISRIYAEILPRMCDLDNSLHVTLLTSGRCRKTLPSHTQITQRSLLPVNDLMRPHRLWWPILQKSRALLQALACNSEEENIWHSTYYTLPMRWNGPIVVTVLDMIHEKFSDGYFGSLNDHFREQKRRCVLAADQIICISNTTKHDVIAHYGLDITKIRVVPLACSTVFQQIGNTVLGNNSRIEKPFILYVGSRVGYKNFNFLLQAYSKWKERSRVDLMVVGPPWSTIEKTQLAALHCTESVHLLGHVNDEQLCSLYNNALAFVYPSLYEGFGIPLLEAMKCGCPIVASQIPSTLEIADTYPIYFDPEDERCLITALDLVIAEGRNSPRVKGGLERSSQYSWERTAQETLYTYYDLVTSS